MLDPLPQVGSPPLLPLELVDSGLSPSLWFSSIVAMFSAELLFCAAAVVVVVAAASFELLVGGLARLY